MRDLFLHKLIDLAFDEDLGAAGDITSAALVSKQQQGRAELWAKEPMVLSGCDVFSEVFARLDPTVKVLFSKSDGEVIDQKVCIAKLNGPLHSLLTGERTALNLIQRTSGIATVTRRAVEAIDSVKKTKLKVLDTRKTSPGMRALSKMAVRHGGASNHRFGLFDGVLIKDNHIAAVGGSIEKALKLARANAPRLVKIEIEVTSLKQLQVAIAHGAHIVMLDNMDDATVQKAVSIAAGRVELEVSGGVTLERLPKLAALGVDYVSMGALTHSARAVDLSLEVMAAKTATRQKQH
jgi:nicotinate-nucleotide pyrophosphorylase (carboxylating)